MRFAFLLLFCCAFFAMPALAEMTDYPEIRLQTLDKSTARTKTIRAKVGSTIEYGSLFIKIQSCRKSDPLDKPENAAFLQIWEVPLGKTKSEWIFSGWMFSSSPAVSAMDHAVYDVWVLECVDPNASTEIEKRVIVTTADDEEIEAANEETLEPESYNRDVVTDQSVLQGAIPEENAETSELWEEPAQGTDLQ